MESLQYSLSNSRSDFRAYPIPVNRLPSLRLEFIFTFGSKNQINAIFADFNVSLNLYMGKPNCYLRIIYLSLPSKGGKHNAIAFKELVGMGGIIEAQNLVKRYGEVKAVDHISLSVQKGELFGLLGPNGSGKTTMIKLLTGQIPPTAGEARIMGIDVVEDPVRVREKVGIVPEQETPPSFLTAEEYLHFVGKIRHLEDIEKQCAFWCDYLDFSNKKDVLCKDLSRGTRQKLMVAQAFLHRPGLVLIDEPLINLDPIMQRKLKDYLVGYVHEGGSVFLSTHILEIAEEICTRIGIIHEGHLVHEGPVSDLRSRSQHLEQFFLDTIGRDVHA
jgi:ABC-2 type transport system ATP-binding protein